MQFCKLLNNSCSKILIRPKKCDPRLFNLVLTNYNPCRFRAPKRFSTYQRPGLGESDGCYKHVMTFDLGEIDHPKYGKATNLTGQLPFVLPREEYNLPEIIKQPERLEEMVNNLIPAVTGLWPTPEETRQRIEDCILIAACLNPPDFDLETQEMKVQVLGWICSIAADDLIDAGHTVSTSIISYTTFMKAFMFWISNVNLTNTNILKKAPKVLLPKQMAAVTSVAQLVLDGMDTLRPTFKEEIIYGQTFHSIISGVWAIWLKYVMDDKKMVHLANPSSDLQVRIDKYNIRGLMEFIAVTHNIKLDPILRQNLLFRLVYQNCQEISMLQNGICGLLRDIATNEVIDSPILTLVELKKTHSLQEAFDQVLQNLLNAYADFQFCSEQLLLVYSRDKELAKFVRMLRYILDGCLYAYSEISRYGLRNKMKVQ